MQPRSKTALWANDGTEATAKSKMPQAVEKEPQGKEAESDDELYEELDVSKAADKQENLKSKKSRKGTLPNANLLLPLHGASFCVPTDVRKCLFTRTTGE